MLAFFGVLAVMGDMLIASCRFGKCLQMLQLRTTECRVE